MKLLIIGDLHGQMPKICFRDFDAIICTGDICDTSFIREIDFKFLAKKIKDKNTKYVEWYEQVGRKTARKKIGQIMKNAKSIVKFLASFKVPVYMVPGNSDINGEPDSRWEFMRRDFFGEMIGGFKNVKNVHDRVIDLGEFSLIGYGFSYGPEYPQEKGDKSFFDEAGLKRKMKNYRKWQKRMDSLFRKAKNPAIFLTHNVPYNTSIDKIEAKQSPRYGLHYGSLIAREMTEKYHPLVCIGGHMHEHYGKIRLGKTTCIAAGFGKNANTLLETEGGKVKGIEFIRK